jgi:hypothetical protein
LSLATACGGDQSRSRAEPQRLSAAEEAIVTDSQVALRSYCRNLALYLAGKRGTPTGPEAQQVADKLDGLIALVREKPEARSSGEETVRQVVEDMAEDLDGTNCSRGFEQKLDQALATLPQR